MHTALKVLVFLLIAGSSIAGPVLVLDEREIDFGISPNNAKVIKTMIMRSVGDEPVIIDKVDTYCECITFNYDSASILPGDSAIAIVELETEKFDGVKTWGIHLYYNESRKARFNVKVQLTMAPESLPVLFVKPYVVSASQFGDKAVSEFSFNITNKSEKHIPLNLIFTDEKYYLIDFPSFVEPNSTAIGRIILNDEGIKKEFISNLIFEFIDENSEQHLYSIPIRRKIFK